MMVFEKEWMPDQISDIEELGQIKQKFSPEKWQLFRSLMWVYLNGMEAGAMLGQDEQARLIG